MAPWKNDDLVLYHGCSEQSLRPSNRNGIAVGTLPHNIDLSVGGRRTEFGRGFYATTWLHEAKEWANRQARSLARGGFVPKAVVVRFDVSRDRLAELDALAFTTENGDFWPFVEYCRDGSVPHARSGVQKEYDVVYGPVSVWPQHIVLKDCDQVSFHTKRALLAVPALTIAATGDPYFVMGAPYAKN